MKNLHWMEGLFFSCLCLCLKTEARETNVEKLIDLLIPMIEAKESPFGTGDHYVIDVVNEKQAMALQRITAQLPYRVSHKIKCNHYGAMGVMQVIPATYEEHAGDGDGDGYSDPENPSDNRETARNYLRWLLRFADRDRNGIIDHWNGILIALNKYSGGARYAKKVFEELSQ